MFVLAVVLILVGLFAIANAIFMFVPAFVQGYPVNSNVLRVIEGVLGIPFIVGGIVLLMRQ